MNWKNDQCYCTTVGFECAEHCDIADSTPYYDRHATNIPTMMTEI